MAKCQFSETQFVMGYLGEYFEQLRTRFPYYRFHFALPSQIIEPLLGADFVIRHLKTIDFFQFKRSEYLKRRRGDREIASGLDKSFVPYYRFQIYNDGDIPQFDRLRYISTLHQNFRTYYCAPRFNTHREFQDLFWAKNIMPNSALIDCRQFDDPRFYRPNFDINDNQNHYLVFNNGTKGYLCSKKEEIEIIKNPPLDWDFQYQVDSIKLIDTLYLGLLERDKVNLETIEFPIETPIQKLNFTTSYLMAKYGIMTILKAE